MTLKTWLAEGRLQSHQTTPQQILDLLALADRNMANATVSELSPDWQFTIAYQAALSLATIPLYLAGYRTVSNKGGHHFVTLSALPETMNANQKDRARFLNICR